jgi:LuxR family transcriptional regulator, quorum-sensing system regulator BjaR1
LGSTDEYGRRALDFVSRMQNATDFDEICAEIDKELEWFGLTAFTSLTNVCPGNTMMDCLLANTRPEEFSLHYVAKNYIEIDPLVTELRRTVRMFAWADVCDNRQLSKNEKYVMEEGREFGLRDGLIIPIPTAGGMLDVFSPCGLQPDLSERARQALDVICTFAHKALQLAVMRKARTEPRHPLTPREREILKWVAVGKTDDEIGTILTLSADTVHSHLKNSMRKLDAGRRTYAVVQALRFGEIAL